MNAIIIIIIIVIIIIIIIIIIIMIIIIIIVSTAAVYPAYSKLGYKQFWLECRKALIPNSGLCLLFYY